MVRIFNHYLHRRTLLQVCFDAGLIVAVLLMVAIGQGATTALPVAASQGLSLAGFVFLINSATGFYQPAAKRSLTETCARALFALVIALPLAYGIFTLLPSGMDRPEVLTGAAMLAVGAVVLHRSYASYSANPAQGRSKILVLGAGEGGPECREQPACGRPFGTDRRFLPGWH